jgi:Spy/CpxP family protein refolding chaperone
VGLLYIYVIKNNSGSKSAWKLVLAVGNILWRLIMSNRLAVFVTLMLSMGGVALPASSYAADTQSKNPATTKPYRSHMYGKDHCQYEAMGYGHGMMGGYGGMMGGYGHGMGMMMESPRMHWVMSLNLTDDQRAKINKLSDELRHDNWATMGKIQDEADKLRDLYEADKRDPKAIDREYQKIFDMKRQMIMAMLVTQNKVEDLLTPEQLSQLKNMRHRHGSMHGYPMR